MSAFWFGTLLLLVLIVYVSYRAANDIEKEDLHLKFKTYLLDELRDLGDRNDLPHVHRAVAQSAIYNIIKRLDAERQDW